MGARVARTLATNLGAASGACASSVAQVRLRKFASCTGAGGLIRARAAASWLATMPLAPPSPLWRTLLPFALAAGLAVFGFWATWFLCDDAFINYRFCGNAYDGHGFVWNPAPWAPVEGYTSFGWVALLYLVWVITSLEPPQTAIPITLCCGLLTLWIVGRRLAALVLPAAAERWRPVFASLVLLGIAGNHSFATWLSSGMETSMFGLVVLLWTLRAMALHEGSLRRNLTWLAVWATFAHLVRPDGDLLVLATLAVAAHAWLLRKVTQQVTQQVTQRITLRATAVALTPLLVPVAHVLWRKWYYGDWQPNTYYAKVVEAWPASGVRYLYCFAVEHGVWLWLPLAMLWLLVMAARHGVRALWGERFAALVAVGTWLAHVGYYTLVVGGDHFAYRVFVHLVPMMLLSSLVMMVSLRLPRALMLGWSILLVVVMDVPGWWMERALVGREADGFVRAAPTVPAVLRPLLVEYDRCQAWLHVHSVGFRRATHALFCAAARGELPKRAPGQIEGAVPGQRLVYRADAVGVVSWALADVAIVDGHGLNDWVIARNRRPPPAIPFDAATLRVAFPTLDLDHDQRLDANELAAAAHLLVSIGPLMRPVVWVDVLCSLSDRDDDGRLDIDELTDAVAQLLPPRQMAHEREPPAGYIEALRPNVTDAGGHRRVLPEVVPLTDDELRAVEQRFRAMVKR